MRSIYFDYLLLVLPVAAWDYVTNGGNWKEGVCANPQINRQSPIDLLDQAEIAKGDFMYFKYPLVGEPLKIYNNGHAIALTLPELYKGGFGIGETADFEKMEKIYRLWQINFHSPSEHTRNGGRLPLEMQLIHKDIRGHQVAGISILFNTGGLPNQFLDVLTEYGLPKKPWDEFYVNKASSKMMKMKSSHASASSKMKDIDFGSVVNGSGYYTYIGSGTTPPCEPNQIWYVRQFPVQCTKDQLSIFQDLLQGLNPPRGNYRETQPLNGRKITLTPAMNMYDPKYEPIFLPAGTAPKPEPLVKDTDVVGVPAFEEIHQCKKDYTPEDTKTCDTPAMVNAKIQVKMAKKNAEAARVGGLGAQLAYNAAAGAYNAAPGLVDKIDAKWGMILAKRNLNGANGARDGAEAAYTAAIANAKAVLESEMLARGETPPEASAPATTQPPPEQVADTTMIPTDFPPEPTILPGQYLAYRPRIYMPRGDAGNPFYPTVAETAPRVGPGYQPKIYEKIKNNLRQPDGSQGQFPPPQLEYVITTTTPAPTTPPPTKAEVVMSVDMDSLENKTAFSEDLKVKLAKVAGVDPDQIDITDIEEAPTTEPPQVGGAAVPGAPQAGMFFQSTRQSVKAFPKDSSHLRNGVHSASWIWEHVR
jgi:carbonic anhydrase